MPPIMERTARPVRNRISIPVPKELSGWTFKILMIPVREEEPKNDFMRFAGKIKWKGDDPVAYQRRLRNEW